MQVNPPPLSPRVSADPAFGVGFDAPAAEIIRTAAGTTLRLPLPRLGGETTASLFPRVRPAGSARGFLLHEVDELLIGCSLQPVQGDPEAAARELYGRLLATSKGRPLYRIWNYVPAINAEPAGLENYRAFCSGRAQAFEAAYGADFKHDLSAASAVGCGGDSLALVFIAGRAAPRHIENPEQVAAYDYPPEHGARSPSFARATVATHAGRPLVFISGTAAIKGHATVAPGRLAEQIDCTFDNLRLIGRAAGVGDDLDRGGRWQRHFKVYLRRAADLPEVTARFAQEFLTPRDRVIYLQADVCRAPLNLEIEATLVGV